MEPMDAIREDLSSKKYADNPKRAIKFLKSVIVSEQRAISKLSGSGKTPTVTFSDDGPQPSTKKDDIKEKKSVIRQVKTLLRGYLQSARSSSRGGGNISGKPMLDMGGHKVRLVKDMPRNK